MDEIHTKEQLFIIWSLEQLIQSESDCIHNEKSIAQFTLHTLNNNPSFIDQIHSDDQKNYFFIYDDNNKP